jgi:hypothetical protein
MSKPIGGEGHLENQVKLGDRGRGVLAIWMSEFKKKIQKQISFCLYFELSFPL